MRIAMMTNNYLPFVGGVPISIQRLSIELKKRGHEVWIFAPEYDNTDEEEDEKNNIIRYHSIKDKMNNGVVIPNVFDKKIKKLFQEKKFDVIHVHHPMLIGNVALHLSRRYKIPLVYTYHTKYEEYLHYIDTISGIRNQRLLSAIEGIAEKIIPHYMKWYLKNTTAIIAPSKDMKDYIMQLDKKAFVKVLPTGLMGEEYVGNPDDAQLLRKWHLQGQKYLLCTVSRMEQEKNQYFLLASISCLKEMIGECFKVLFIGDGNERRRLEDYSKSLGIENVVEFTGCVPNQEVKYYLNASDLFVFSSKSETQGIVILEAMAASVPIVAVDATGVRDIVRSMENGILVSEQVEIFAKAVKRILVNQELREQMSRMAMDTAKAYGMEEIAKEAEQFYNEAISKVRRIKYESCFNCGG